MTVHAWPEPAAGDIVWCRFPDGIRPRPKPRPGLILTVFGDCTSFTVRVAYGTSRRTTAYRGEFAIRRVANPAAFTAAKLGFDTKFDLRRCVDLPYTSEWFPVPLVRAVQAAYQAARD